MFNLTRYAPAWHTQLIDELEAPFVRGLQQLRALSEGAGCLLIALETLIDYDGVYDKVMAIEALPASANLGEQANLLLDRAEEKIANLGDWALETCSVLPFAVLPVTGSVMPGNWLPQLAGRKYSNASPYEALYLRILRGDATSGSNAVDQLVIHNDYRMAMIDFVLGLGRSDVAAEVRLRSETNLHG